MLLIKNWDKDARTGELMVRIVRIFHHSTVLSTFAPLLP